MKTKIYSLIIAFATLPLFSQVGINTNTPTATLDVNGNMRVRNTPTATTVPGYQLLVQDTGSTEVYAMDPQLLIGAANVNSGMYSAKKTTGISLVNVALFPATFKPVNFLTNERTIGSAAMFSDSDSSFIIPSTGVYMLGYTFRYGTGLQADLLVNGYGIGIARTRSGVGTIIDTRPFSGLDLLVAKLTISEASINSLYSFQAGDKVSFGLTGSNVLSLSIAGSSVSSFYIYKVSN
ncbi:uncharacterized protein CHSO_1769 [Chryseobacterium sp. StRB126]|uniref:hypothetical protein n=1 Tax=Chryseobacterium sp. StRB126 TaxID=878220 RepID=UPI0004E99014|nr:hypothetical protein [Chryseobacterium sp. StRB126]BAP30806.1 uncharacterized protein CHSO_1769 [Chryseobacterium sp. StRB126]